MSIMQIPFFSKKSPPRLLRFRAAAAMSLLVVLMPVSAIASMPIMAKTADAEALRSTRLDAKLIESRSRVIGNGLVESVFRAKVRAYGGDILLPAYGSDVVYKPSFMSPLEKSNAIIPGTAAIRVDRDLPTMQGRFVLREYEDAEITITVTSRIIPEAITSDRLVFKIQLASIIWKPVIQEFNEDEVGNPLLDISPVGWETNPAVVFKKMPEISFRSMTDIAMGNPGPAAIAAAESPRAPKALSGMASIISIFSKIFSK